MHEPFPYLREILLFLGAATIVIPFLNRLKVNPVLGYLTTGIIIGPHCLGTLSESFPFLSWFAFTNPKSIEVFAEMGVVFLLFSIGLELSFNRLWKMRKMIFGLGAAQVLITALVIGGIASLWGNSVEASVLIGGSLALSSTAVVIKILIDKHRFTTPVGQNSFSILLFQDLAVVPLIILVSVFAKGGDDIALSVLSTFVEAFLIIVAIIVLGRIFFKPAFRFVASTFSHSPELLTALALLIVIGTAALTGAAGMSMALGAFLAGLLLAETEFSHQVEADIEPFKGLFLGLFFISVGMVIDFSAVMSSFVWVILSVIGLFMVKSLITSFCCYLFKMDLSTSAQTGAILGQGGEFAFIIVTYAATQSIIPEADAQFMLVVASVTMLATPFMFVIADKIKESLHSKSKSHDLPEDNAFSNHLIIVGFGRVGQTVASLVASQEIKYVGIDISPHFLANAETKGLPVFLGDVRHEAILKSLGADKAKAAILTLDSRRSSLQIIKAIKHYFPNLKILSRALDREHAQTLKELGAEVIVLETLEMSLQLGAEALEEFEIPDDVIHGLLEEKRDSAYTT